MLINIQSDQESSTSGADVPAHVMSRSQATFEDVDTWLALRNSGSDVVTAMVAP